MRTALMAVPLLLLLSLLGPPDPAVARPEDDGRVGAVLDLQGTALVRPVGRQRWTPLAPRSLLMPGDQVKTFARGAHAVEIRLAAGGTVALGPNALVEMTSKTGVRILRGDLEAKGAAVTGPGGFKAAAVDRAVYRAKRKKTGKLEKDPRWLTGYRSSTTDEWMGSLVANVDGRNTPLTIGYHKVDVVIRDQIAVTTIEESFVNHTSSRLEGIFTFPLPADASISGFGMWIGDELVMADIVEKQRAREIYEDILRRRKDPGLLEWSGGNLFKARVFPIFGMSEKRIKIRYTQVLPLAGKSIRYQYALRSELLQANPLRDLRIKVTIHSDMPIATAASLSHECRIRKTENDAVIEYDAQETTPTRDFELRIDLAEKPSLAAVPHRRGEDGYFMLLLSPPDPSSSGWKRDLTPEGDPLDILVLADTSGSMDPAQRDTQEDFIEALLALLSKEDRVRIAACDEDVHWFDERERGAAIGQLASRISLGWTDLDKVLKEAMFVSGQGAHVIYLGDGIGTTGDADPVDLARRIGLSAGDAKATFHAVSTGTTYEKPVLEALAAVGGGSVRAADSDPAAAAYGLLAEIAQPTVKDLRVKIDGIRTARVYPERPANLPAGGQHAILGRFLPTGETQSGTVTVTGTLDGKPVRFSTDLSIDPGEAGNSFLPRLWARRHLDALLQQGASMAVQEEIVAFSEEFGIMTPYTSFLVLESDEDRERYGVTRRVAMRDGERFFAAAKDQANTEILRQQMRAAKTWRLDMRRRMLREIAGLGRDLPVAIGWSRYDYDGGGVVGGGAGGRSGPVDSLRLGMDSGLSPAGAEVEEELFDDPVIKDAKIEDHNETDMDEAKEALKKSRPREPGMPMAQPAPRKPAPADSPFAPASGPMPAAKVAGGYYGESSLSGRFGGKRSRDYRRQGRASNEWIRTGTLGMFPIIPPAPVDPEPQPDPDWPADILAVVKSLDRRAAVRGFTGGLESRSVYTSFDPKRGYWTGRSEISGYLSPSSRMQITDSLLGQPFLTWIHAGERGSMFTTTGIGRTRPAADNDRKQIHGFPGLTSWHSFLQGYRNYKAEWVSKDGAPVVIRFFAPGVPANQSWEVRLTIDTDKRVILEQASWQAGKRSGRTVYRAFRKIGAHWWPTFSESRNADDEVTGVQKIELIEHSPAEIEAMIAAALEPRSRVLFLPAVDPTPAAAKQAVADGKAGLPEHLVHMLSYGVLGQWDEMWKAWPEVEKRAEGKRGLVWVRVHLLTQSRRGAELQTLLTGMAKTLAATSGEEPMTEAIQILNRAGSLGANEQLTIRDTLRPLFPTQGPEGLYFGLYLDRQRATLLRSAGRADEARKLWESILARRRGDRQAIGELLNFHRAEGAESLLAFAKKAFADEHLFHPHERDWLHQQIAQQLWNVHRYDEFMTVVDRWIEKRPENEMAYEYRLAGLLYTKRVDEMTAWIEKTLAAGLPENEVAADRARLGAAIDAAVGQSWNMYSNRLARRWVKPLADLAWILIRLEQDPANLGGRILNNWRLKQTDEHRELLTKLRGEIGKPGTIEAMSVAHLQRWMYSLSWQRTQADEDLFKNVVSRVRAKWREAKLDGERAQMNQLILHICDQFGEKALAVDFLREALKTVPELRRNGVISQLFRRLTSLPWTAAIEDELFTLLPQLVAPNLTPLQREGVYAGQARWLASQLFRMKTEHALGPVKEREKLPRKELRLRMRDGRAAARIALAARFALQAKGAPEEIRRWYEIESLGYGVESGEDLAGVEGRAREILLGGGDTAKDALDHVLRRRSSLVLAYASVSRHAPKEIAERTLALFREKVDGGSKLLDWRYELFRLLVALDRTDGLITTLTSWIDPQKVESGWRLALGYLLAEKGRLAEAAERFEEVGKLEELAEADWARLAEWYLVLGDDAKRARAMEMRYKFAPEYSLQQRLQRFHQRVRRRGNEVPEELDPETFPTLRALLRKTSWPGNQIRTIRSIYNTTKDFRILECLVDGATGHSPEATYPYLTRCAQILANVHEEATCDELSRRLDERAGEDLVATDRRALRLLEMQVERRAAKVLNQPGPHAAKALAAMRAGFPDQWRPGEKVLMARFLGALGKIRDEALAKEQIRQMTAIHNDTGAGTWERLDVGQMLAQARWRYDDADLAIDLLANGLDEYRDAQKGVLPANTTHLTDLLIRWLESKQRFRRGEDRLLAEEGRQPGPDRRAWYRMRVLTLYRNCLAKGGTVSIGTGPELYAAARKLMLSAAFDLPAGFCPQAIHNFVQLHRTAHRNLSKEPVEAGNDLIEFSKSALPEVLLRIPNQRSRQHLSVAQAVREIVGPLEALTLLVRAVETEPTWYRDSGRGSWQQFAYQMARWRTEAKKLGALEPRLLAIVLRELERDLVTLQHRHGGFTHRNNSYFWTEKADDFATVTRKVIELHAESPATVLFAAKYFWHGLHLRDEAIDVLIDADERGRLVLAGRAQLVEWLQYRQRWPESLPHCERLVAESPDQLAYRLFLIRALHGVDRDPDGRKAVAATEKRFRDQGRWVENAVAQTGKTCLEVGYFDEAARLYEDALSLNGQSRRRNQGGTRSFYYGQLAKAYSGLGRDDDAVNAASGAVVSWGRHVSQRGRALGALQKVIAGIKDLDAWLARYDAKVAETGMDAPVIRKSIAKVFLKRRNWSRAAVQFTAARELSPFDREIHRDLVIAHTNAGKPRQAIRALIETGRRFPRDLAIYNDLAKRYEKIDRPGQAERARTTLAEIAPHEADGHRRLAKLRDGRKEFAAAVVQWKQVVRIRTLEPDGWLALALAQSRAGDKRAALVTLDEVLDRNWDQRFGNVKAKAAKLRTQIEGG